MVNAYTMTPDHKGRFLISENGRQVARAFSHDDALRITRALADAEMVQAQIALLEREPVGRGLTHSLTEAIRKALGGV